MTTLHSFKELVSKATLFKVLAICFIFTSVYLCQYYEIRARTEPVHRLFKEIKDNIPTRTRQIQDWQDSVKDGIYFTDFESDGLDINPAKNYNDTQVFMSKKLVTHTVSKIPESKNRMDLDREVED